MSDYGVLARALHRLALGSPAVAEASFDAEQAVNGRDLPDAAYGRHVFVAGLARSGTTVLMRALYATGAFASLTYRDMPFVLAPGLWARVAGGSRAARPAAERAHGDAVLVDFDSPEALEEVFWRTFAGPDYIRPDRLLAMRADAATLARFRRYVALVLRRYGATRYLSKNNNNVLRLASLLEAFPAARILVPYRDPHQQARSLLRQHRRFRDIHRSDRFAAAYMGWLVHHEFGADHRPLEWGRAAAAGRDPDTLDYWLAQWVGVYGHLAAVAERLPQAILPVSYEALCAGTGPTWPRLAAFAGLGEAAPPAGLRPAGPAEGGSGSRDLVAAAAAIRERLDARAARPFAAPATVTPEAVPGTAP